MIKFTGTENSLAQCSHVSFTHSCIYKSHPWRTAENDRKFWTERERRREDGETGVAIILERLLLCSVALICFFSRPHAHSFDPLLDHPLDDSLTAKEIKYIRLTTLSSPLHHPSPRLPLSPLSLPPLPPSSSPSSLLLPEASISSIDKQRICFLSLHSPSLSCLSCLPFSFSFFLFAVFNPNLTVDACQRCNSIV